MPRYRIYENVNRRSYEFKYQVHDEHGDAVAFTSTLWGARRLVRRLLKRGDSKRVLLEEWGS